MNTHPTNTRRIYRVDKFAVPPQARDEFLEKVLDTHKLLRVQPGYLQDFVLEQSAGPGEFNVITILEWENQDAVEQAKIVVSEMQKKAAFNPQELIARLGIKADIGSYRRVEA